MVIRVNETKTVCWTNERISMRRRVLHAARIIGRAFVTAAQAFCPGCGCSASGNTGDLTGWKCNNMCGHCTA